jgi:hypothetical protein
MWAAAITSMVVLHIKFHSINSFHPKILANNGIIIVFILISTAIFLLSASQLKVKTLVLVR